MSKARTSSDNGSLGQIDGGIVDELVRRAEKGIASSVSISVGTSQGMLKLVEVNDGCVVDQAERAIFVHLATTLQENHDVVLDLRVFFNAESYAWRLRGSEEGWSPDDPEILRLVVGGSHRTIRWDEIPTELVS